MKTILRTLIACTITGMAAGCNKDFISLAPVSNANAENFYKTTEDFNLAVNAAYNSLYTIYAPEGAVSYVSEQMGDNAIVYNISGIEADKWAFKDYNLKPSNTMVYTFWQDFYKALFNINITLAKIDEAALNATFSDGVRAEMRFLRALYYFNMVRIWGELPIVTKPLTGAESYAVLRSSVADVYNLIVDDLNYAIGKLPPASAITVKGKASKGAAQVLLGEVYLTQGKKAEAATVLKVVYDSQEYQLQPTYAGVFGPAVKNSKESIFEIQQIGGAPTNPYSKYYQTFFPNTNIFGFYGGGMNQVTDDLYNEYEAADPRRDVTIALGYQNGATFVNQKYTKKWTDAAAPVNGGNALANNNFMIYRYADLLLMLSEATADAKYLNEVRARVALPLYGAAGYPAQYNTLDLAIEHERRVELAIEFHRFFDLKRTNRSVTVLGAKGKNINQDKLLLPIPSIVRTQNPAISQNNGYN